MRKLLITAAAVLASASLGLATAWVWNVWGTGLSAHQRAQRDVDAFYRAYPAPISPVTGDLHTDFARFPPPVPTRLVATDAGAILGIMTVPSWEGQAGVYDEALRHRIPVKEGSQDPAVVNNNLDSGAASHYWFSQQAGQLGNFAMSGHRRSYGENFSRVPDLETGDVILFESADAWYVYSVTDVRITTADDPAPMWPTPSAGQDNPEAGAALTDRLITLTTCAGADGSAFDNDHRAVVHGRLVGWIERDRGVPPQIVAP